MISEQCQPKNEEECASKFKLISLCLLCKKNMAILKSIKYYRFIYRLDMFVLNLFGSHEQ